MARIRIEEIVEHLEMEFRNVLEATAKEIAPNAGVDRFELFRIFRREIRRKFSTWEEVPDQLIEK